jgi:hypothetical protein
MKAFGIYAFFVLSLFIFCACDAFRDKTASAFDQYNDEYALSNDELMSALEQNNDANTIILFDEKGNPSDALLPKEIYQEQLAYFLSYFENEKHSDVPDAILLHNRISDNPNAVLFRDETGEATMFVFVHSMILDLFGNAKIEGRLLIRNELSREDSEIPVPEATSESPKFELSGNETTGLGTEIFSSYEKKVKMYIQRKEAEFITLEVIFE